MPTLIPDVTFTLPADEAAQVLASLRRSQRPRVRKIAERLDTEVQLPLFCPVSFKEGNAELCGPFGSDAATEPVIELRDHLVVTHGLPLETAEYQAAVAYKRWAPTAE